jgi:hypothetical protein
LLHAIQLCVEGCIVNDESEGNCNSLFADKKALGVRIEPETSKKEKRDADQYIYRLCGLVVRVLGSRSGGPGSILGTTIKKNSGSGTESTQPREYN